MIRSLVIAPQSDPSVVVEGESTSTDPAVLRRNLTQDSLEKCLADGFTMWIDIVTPDAKEIHWLEGLLQLSPNVVEDLLREDSRPTLLVYPGYLFLSLFQPNIQSSTLISKEVHCLLGERFCVTVRQADVTALEEAYNRVAQNPAAWYRGAAFFLYLTAQHVIDTYYPLLDRISNQLNELEAKLLNDGADIQAQRSVYRVKQHLIGLRQMIAPQREVLSNLIGEQRVSTNDEIRDLFRHLYERLLGIYDVIDAQRDLTNNALEIIANQQSRKMGEAVNRLTIFSMVFLPFTFLVGLFGLDYVTIATPVVLQVNGLVMLCAVTLLMLASVAGMFWAFHRRGWV